MDELISIQNVQQAADRLSISDFSMYNFVGNVTKLDSGCSDELIRIKALTDVS